ncbi:MAG: effector-associated domain EAD1-containing protein [Bryobacteraceae bacterium]
MLNGEELKKLIAALLGAYPNYADLEQMVLLELDENLAALASQQANQQKVLFELVVWARRVDRLEDLLAAAARDQPANKTLRATLNILREAIESRKPKVWYTAPSPFLACFVQRNQPFIDRHDFRKSLEHRLRGANAFGALVVNGPSGVGKSHCYELIVHVARSEVDVDVAWINLKRSSTFKMPPDAFVRELALQIALDTASLPKQEITGTADPRWARELAAWLIGQVKTRSNKTWWVVLDAFNHPSLPAETRELIHLLIERAGTDLDRLKFVLLDYQAPPEILGFVHQDRDLSEVTRSDLIGFLEDVHSHKGLPPAEDVIEGYADDILAAVAVPEGHPGRMKAVADAVAAKMREVFPEAP